MWLTERIRLMMEDGWMEGCCIGNLHHRVRKQSFIISKIIIGFSTFRNSHTMQRNAALCKKPIMKGWMGCFECCNYRCLQQCQLLSSVFPFFAITMSLLIIMQIGGDQDINILWQVLYHYAIVLRSWKGVWDFWSGYWDLYVLDIEVFVLWRRGF